MRLNATRRPGPLTLALAAAALLSGCGSHSPEAGPAAGAASKAVARKAVNPADELSPYMVSAVAANKPSTVPVQLKFELRDRPGVGQPLVVDLAIVPMSASVDRVSGKVEGEDGLELTDGGVIAATERPPEGVPIRHSVKVVPGREGIFTVRASVSVDAAGSSSTETYSIPVIATPAADGPRGAPAAPAAAASTSAAASRPAHGT
ncbi:MAG: hypothetical protein JO184_01070 [Gammaproteobacteria bacterium]|nr:hypothetical protein [Gammaproteobacteria bacterium]MBV8405853.1 hypothetical protein [Gammaproteobacteria bacterium]